MTESTLTDARRDELRDQIAEMSRIQAEFFSSAMATPRAFQNAGGVMSRVIEIWRKCLAIGTDPETADL